MKLPWDLGHDESKVSLNKGNFVELMQLIAAHGSILIVVMYMMDLRMLTILHQEFKIICIFGFSTLQNYLCCCSVSWIFSIFVDESKQKSVILRYLCRCELWLCSRACSHNCRSCILTDDGITSAMLTTLANHQLMFKTCVSGLWWSFCHEQKMQWCSRMYSTDSTTS